VSTALTRRDFSRHALALFAAGVAGSTAARSGAKIPVVLDTDIGDDIDDTWALLMLLRMPQFDLQLALGDYGNARYRARLLAKLLHRTGRSDVAVGIGVNPADDPGQQSSWLGNYQLSDYPGVVYEDGVQALIDTINNSPQPVTLICIGPVPNIAEALRRDPGIADNARFVGMHGSVFVGYNGSATPDIEWNVRVAPLALQAVFNAPWDCTITPLDTCGLVKLQGENYRRLYESDDPWLKILMENYRAWLPGAPFVDPATDTSRISTTLFDTVAIYLAAAQDLVEVRDLPLRVADDGRTVVDQDNGRIVHCAVTWKNLAAFEEKLVDILLG
jgi:inosine-uridine nucleoside N-ribohydrolase